MGKGTGFGKTILIGDQFVLEEVPAIVSAISFETVTTVERTAGEGWTLEDNRSEVPGYKEKKKEQQARSIDRILEVMNIDVKQNPIKITIGGTLLAGSGVGASAASCVSLARALNEEFNMGCSIEEINRVAWQGEFPYHGVASGVDNTASTYGGLLLFQLIKGGQHFEKIKTPRPFEIVLANSGITANTALLDEFSERQKKEDPALRLAHADHHVPGLRYEKGPGGRRPEGCGRRHVDESQAPGRDGDTPTRSWTKCASRRSKEALGARRLPGEAGEATWFL